MSVDGVRVGDVLRLEREAVDPDPACQYVTIGVRSFGKGIFHYEPKPGDQLGKLRFFRVRPDRLIVSNIKGWEGAIAVSSPGEAGCLASNRFLMYTPKDSRIDVRWAYWFLLSEPGLELIRRASPGSADRNRTLAIERFENLEIPLPPIEEQRRAAGSLSAVNRHSRTLGERAGIALELQAALAVSVCSRPDMSHKARVEQGWSRVPLGTVMSPTNNHVPVVVGESYPNFGIYSFGRGLFLKPAIRGEATSAKTLTCVAAGQFIYSRLFAFEGAYAYVSREFDNCFVSKEFPAFDPDPDALDARWLATYLRSPDRWAELAESSKGLGVRRQRIPIEAILAYKVWLPPIDVQRSMVRFMDSLESARQSRGRAEQRIESLLPATLNHTFSSFS